MNSTECMEIFDISFLKNVARGLKALSLFCMGDTMYQRLMSYSHIGSILPQVFDLDIDRESTKDFGKRKNNLFQSTKQS